MCAIHFKQIIWENQFTHEKDTNQILLCVMRSDLHAVLWPCSPFHSSANVNGKFSHGFVFHA